MNNYQEIVIRRKQIALVLLKELTAKLNAFPDHKNVTGDHSLTMSYVMTQFNEIIKVLDSTKK